MKIKTISISTLLCLSSLSFAEEYQTFLNLDYTDTVNADVLNVRTIGVNGIHYFNAIESLGPYNEFDFLITESNVTASYTNTDFEFNSPDFLGFSNSTDVSTVGGQLFYGDFLFGASYSNFEGEDLGTFSLGYLLTPNLLVSVELPTRGVDAFFNLRYQHDLGNNSYIGINVRTDNELNSLSLEPQYFTPLANGRFLTVGVNFVSIEDVSDFGGIFADYYFNKNTSLGLNLGDDIISVGATHFFNKNFSVRGEYAFTDEVREGVSLNLGVTYQF